MIPPEPLPSRRALRAERERADADAAATPGAEPSARTAAQAVSAGAAAGALADGTRRARVARPRTRLLVIAAAAILLIAAVAAAVALGGRGGSTTADATQQTRVDPVPAVTSLPVPAQSAATVVAAGCDDPAVSTALAQGSDADVIAALGGATAFRDLVATGSAPCVNLADPVREWVVVNKQRPLSPLEWEPDTVVAPADMQRTVDGRLRPAAADALTALVAAAQAEGVGAIGLNSAFRSFDSQTRTYNGYVNSLGRESADLQSARPGFSEHQTGLATDVAACDGGCGAIESFGGTAQGAWVAANAWRFGFIVRYEDGYTAITGYQAEPWHLRYIGPELAQVYHDGGFHTLEDFFGLPPAPDYVD
ncbi:MAG: M15 family metallopeptidase [Microbacterium sp.]|uniref:M15 family metallopeptidase n=1 Tax=Microbacterium sp. TaxID=51671 RepID=UPI001AD0E379|nr:M15 family metallopeptidase [Microbacterium sp.]MBN9176711.1 M15 family metallopeptidase [Microbacterium sp.]